MRFGHFRQARVVGAFLILLPIAGAPVAGAQQATAMNQPVASPATAPANSVSSADSGIRASELQKLPDSPGAVRFQITAANQQDSASAPEEAPPAKPAPAERQPVGTAAAESITTSGVAASAPEGTAIAPAKQRQVRSMLIRMGAVVGASVAVGTTLALTAATPSKPPGAH